MGHKQCISNFTRLGKFSILTYDSGLVNLPKRVRSSKGMNNSSQCRECTLCCDLCWHKAERLDDARRYTEPKEDPMKLGIEKMGQRFSNSVETNRDKAEIITIRVRSIGLCH